MPGRRCDIGLVLTAGGLVALVGQMPGGALVDAVRSARFAAGVAVVAICASALAIALWPIFLIVIGARALHAAASCVLGPAIAAISLGLVGHAALGRAHRPQCAVRIDRQRRCGRRHGRLRLSGVEPGGVPAHRAPGRTGAARAGADPDRATWCVRADGSPIAARGRDGSAASFRSLLCNRRLIIFGRLRPAVPARQRGDAAADGKHHDDALERVGDDGDRRLHRGAAARGRAVRAMGRPASPDPRSAAAAARVLRRRWRCARRCSRW